MPRKTVLAFDTRLLLGDSLENKAGGLFDALLVVEFAEGDAEGAGDFFRGEADGVECGGDFVATSGAGGASREVDLFFFELVDEALGVEAGDGDREVAGELAAGVTEKEDGRVGGEEGSQGGLQGGEAFLFGMLGGYNIADRGGEADDAWDVFCARAEAGFLAAAEDEGFDRRARADPEGGDAFWTVDLRRGEGEEVDAEAGDFYVEEVHGGGGVGVEVERGGVGGLLAAEAFGFYNLGDFAEGLDGAEFAAREGDGDELDGGGDFLREVGEIEEAVFVDSYGRVVFCGGDYGGVLGGGDES